MNIDESTFDYLCDKYCGSLPERAEAAFPGVISQNLSRKVIAAQIRALERVLREDIIIEDEDDSGEIAY